MTRKSGEVILRISQSDGVLNVRVLDQVAFDDQTKTKRTNNQSWNFSILYIIFLCEHLARTGTKANERIKHRVFLYKGPVLESQSHL